MDREKRQANTALALYTIVAVLLLLLPLSPLVGSIRGVASFVFYPFLKPAEALLHHTANIPDNVSSLLDTANRSRELAENQKTLEISLAQYNSLLEINRRYTELTAVEPEFKWQGKWARVISAEPPHNYSGIVINRGSRDGVAVKDTVLAVYGGRAGLAGKITEVSGGTSKVMLISNPMSSVTCEVKGKGFDALLEGLNGKYLRLNYIPMDSNIAVGDEIITSPVSSLFPQAVNVGRVTEIHSREQFMTFLSAKVEPVVNVGGIKEVFVITGGAKTEAGK
ncbi:MAG: rod shape-determining protein MreC [Elusimicrobiaceae bacterium]|jgi:rod shape-determining protein MreC